ncbi:hypothetical protein [Nocardiopsis sp. NPDC057823]|uniref:hypothetical protein n=1 Tax=Nocardiopsis sp. NPDC057823 TaxID=3346256 RepID=UPI0036735D84
MEPDRWMTWRAQRRVLAIAHTVADTQRLMDPVKLLASDPRVQVVFTIAPHSVFGAGVRTWLEEAGPALVPWEQAVRTRFDAALAASPSRDLDMVHAPLVLFAHGVGFNKLIPARPGRHSAGPRQTYGLARENLLREGRLIPARVALAHHDEEARLASECPETAGAARVVGDAVADRLLSAAEHRDLHRAALGIGRDQRLVVAASTWGPASLLGADRRILAHLVAQARGGACRVALLAHPNVRAAHGAWQVEEWLRPLTRAGLILGPASPEWVNVLAAADAVVGDHGSTTLYATLLGRPVFVTRSGAADIDPASPMGEALRSLPVASGRGPSLDRLLEGGPSEAEQRTVARLAARVTSYPLGFADRARDLLYELLRLPDPIAQDAFGPPAAGLHGERS